MGLTIDATKEQVLKDTEYYDTQGEAEKVRRKLRRQRETIPCLR